MSLGARVKAAMQGDLVIWMVIAFLTIFSALTVYSSSSMLALQIAGGNTEAVFMKHVLISGFGIFLIYILHLTPYQRFSKMAPYLVMAAILLLIATLALGAEVNSAKRWLKIPFIGLTFQTSDFARLALILWVAREVTQRMEQIKDLKGAFLPIILPVLIVCGLIAPADFSTAGMLFMTVLVMLFVGRVSVKHIMVLIGSGLLLVGFLIVLGQYFPDMVRVTTWISRVSAWVSGDEVYQVTHSKIAIANGEIFGNGPGNSEMRNYLPSPYADFIYSIIIEEYGLFGGLMVLSLYMMLLYRIVVMITKSQKSFGAIAAIGLGMNIVIQALTHIAVSINVLPVTGLPLPMVSKGGTSILFTCIAFGIILSISRYIENAQYREETAVA